MHDLMSQRKSGFLLGISLLITAVIGFFLFSPLMLLIRLTGTMPNGMAVPDFAIDQYLEPTYDVSVSDNGQRVAFTSNINSLLYGNPLSNKGLFLYDHHVGKTRQISTGLWHPFVSIEKPKISGNGNYILFLAFTYNKNSEVNPRVKPYLYDIESESTEAVNLPEKVQLSALSELEISQDGRFIVGQAQGLFFIYNRVTNTYEQFSEEQLINPTQYYQLQSFNLLSNQVAQSEAENGFKDLEDLTRPRQNKLYDLSSDEQTAIVALGKQYKGPDDINLTVDLYRLDRTSGQLNRIPAPNWKLSAFLILTAVNTALAGYILFTESARKWPFPTP